MGRKFDDTVPLLEIAWTLNEIVAISGVKESSIRNWMVRGNLDLGEKHFGGKSYFSLIDALRVAAMQGMTSRAGIKPSDAKTASEMIVCEIVKRAPRDADGKPVLNPNSIPRNLALTLAVVDDATQVGWIDPTQDGYSDFRGSWGAAHIVVPVASLLANVVGNLTALTQRAEPESVPA